jgi:hypothetical protein
MVSVTYRLHVVSHVCVALHDWEKEQGCGGEHGTVFDAVHSTVAAAHNVARTMSISASVFALNASPLRFLALCWTRR